MAHGHMYSLNNLYSVYYVMHFDHDQPTNFIDWPVNVYMQKEKIWPIKLYIYTYVKLRFLRFECNECRYKTNFNFVRLALFWSIWSALSIPFAINHTDRLISKLVCFVVRGKDGIKKTSKKKKKSTKKQPSHKNMLNKFEKWTVHSLFLVEKPHFSWKLSLLILKFI